MRNGLWSLSRQACRSRAWNISRARGCQLHHKFKERRSSPRILSGKLGRRGGRFEFSSLRLIPKFILGPFRIYDSDLKSGCTHTMPVGDNISCLQPSHLATPNERVGAATLTSI